MATTTSSLLRGLIPQVNTTSRTYAHMDIPWWICHDDMELAQDRIVESTQVAINPLRWELHHNFHSFSKVANVRIDRQDSPWSALSPSVPNQCPTCKASSSLCDPSSHRLPSPRLPHPSPPHNADTDTEPSPFLCLQRPDRTEAAAWAIGRSCGVATTATAEWTVIEHMWARSSKY